MGRVTRSLELVAGELPEEEKEEEGSLSFSQQMRKPKYCPYCSWKREIARKRKTRGIELRDTV
jgi:hypothetical protein